MFNPSEIEAMPLELEKLFRSLEERIMADIVRKLKANGQEITRATDWQLHRLYELGKSKTEIKEELKDVLKLSDSQLERIFSEVIKEGYARDESLYKLTGAEFIPFEDNKQLQQLIQAVKAQTAEQFQNITNSLGFAVRQPDGTLKFQPIADYYQKTLDKAMVDITSGAFDYNTVLKRTIKELTNSGMRTVDYASGWSNRVPVAIRRAVVTGFNQVVARVNEDNAEKIGTDTFEVSWHSGHRPSHWWGGQWFTKEKLISVCGLGEADGLCGCNCYHSYSPVVPGASVPTYSKEQLAQMEAEENKKIEYNGKEYTKYEALQRQRKLETRMRAQRQDIKLLQEGEANEDDIIGAKVKYRITSDEYVRFSEAMNLPQQRERVTVDSLRNIGNIKTPKTVANSSESGIINTKKNISKSVEIPDDCEYLLKADTNFTDKNVSEDVLRTINNAIERKISVKKDFSFEEIKIAKFAEDDKSVFITNMESTGTFSKTQLYLNKEYFLGTTVSDCDSLCKKLAEVNWWKSISLTDLVNHEIMHARINYYNSFEKAEQLYQFLFEDTRVQGFCGLVDKYPSEFLNEMFVAINNGSKIDEKYMIVYDEYVNNYLR